jgi:hypothetical protein
MYMDGGELSAKMGGSPQSDIEKTIVILNISKKISSYKR